MIKLYDSKDSVPEAQRASAIETKDGKWVAEEDGGDAAKKALDAERDARAKADAKAKAASDALKAAEKERDELKLKADAAASGITDAKLQEIRDAEAKARKPIEDENAALKAKLRKVTLSDRLEAKLLKAGVMPDRIEKAKKDLLADSRVDLTEDGEGFVVKDAAGKLTSESIDDFVTTTYKKEAPFFYAGSGANGSGGEGSNGGGGSGYDPVAAGKAAADQQKKGAGDTKIAFT